MIWMKWMCLGPLNQENKTRTNERKKEIFVQTTKYQTRQQPILHQAGSSQQESAPPWVPSPNLALLIARPQTHGAHHNKATADRQCCAPRTENNVAPQTHRSTVYCIRVGGRSRQIWFHHTGTTTRDKTKKQKSELQIKIHREIYKLAVKGRKGAVHAQKQDNAHRYAVFDEQSDFQVKDNQFRCQEVKI